MRKILLRSNRRIGAAGLLVAIALSGLAACLLLIPNMVSKFASVVVVVLACVVFALWYRYASGPRLEITEDELWVYVVGRSKPFRIPIDAVEVFFIGQGAVAGTEPGQPHGYRGAVAANVIIRLAESAVDWHHRDVNLQLGVWGRRLHHDSRLVVRRHQPGTAWYFESDADGSEA